VVEIPIAGHPPGHQWRSPASDDPVLASQWLATYRTGADFAGTGAVAAQRYRRADSPQCRGNQYLSIRYTERLAEANVNALVDSIGDSYDNALAETIKVCIKPK
jgi:hypothetical protein